MLSIASPAYVELFNQISLHVCGLGATSSSEPVSKKRRLEVPDRSSTNGANGGITLNGIGTAPASANNPILLEIKEVSVVVPQRKKYTLCFTSTHLYARLPDSKEPVQGISFAWKDIGMQFRVFIYIFSVHNIADANVGLH